MILSYALVFSLLIGEIGPALPVTRQIDVPCSVLREKSDRYFIGHHFYTGAIAGNTQAGVSLGLAKDALTPSGEPLILNRSSIHRYTVHRHLSLMKSYTTFRLTGQLSLVPVSESSCAASLRFNYSAFEYVWSLAAIDDGYRSQFTSNGELERGYLDALAALLSEHLKTKQ